MKQYTAEDIMRLLASVIASVGMPPSASRLESDGLAGTDDQAEAIRVLFAGIRAGELTAVDDLVRSNIFTHGILIMRKVSEKLGMEFHLEALDDIEFKRRAASGEIESVGGGAAIEFRNSSTPSKEEPNTSDAAEFESFMRSLGYDGPVQ